MLKCHGNGSRVLTCCNSFFQLNTEKFCNKFKIGRLMDNDIYLICMETMINLKITFHYLFISQAEHQL